MALNSPFRSKSILIFQVFSISSALALCSLDCPENLVNFNQIGNEQCDKICMNQGCDFDGGDCESYCYNEIACDLKSNGICDSVCNFDFCGFDHGDCGYCSDGCTIEFLNDNACHPECNNYQCNFNNYTCECNPGCNKTMMGDGICDWACMNHYCQYDGGDCLNSTCSPGCNATLFLNNVCDNQCNTPSCLYDNNVCLCAQGCTPDLLENSTCNDECAFKLCNYDNHQCGDCAIDCFNNMINNKICNSECNNEDCGFDGDDCLSCAPGCLLTDLWWCKPECVVLDCDFCLTIPTAWHGPSFAAQLTVRDWNYPVTSPNSCYANHGCVQDIYQPHDCSMACNNADCYYDYFSCSQSTCYSEKCKLCISLDRNICWYCQESIHLWGLCVDNCPRYYEVYLHIPLEWRICIRVLDESTEEMWDESFISADNVSQGNGTIDFPYNSLSYGLSRLEWKYSVVYLMKGIHNLTLVYDNKYLYDTTASRPSYQGTRKLLWVTVKPLYCTIYNQTGCVNDNEKITVMVDTNPITLDIMCNITFEGIIFDGSPKFSPFCSDCDYCKKVTTNANGKIVDDHNNILDANSYVPQSTCDLYKETNFIEISSNGILTLNNIEIINFRQQYNSIITLNGGILNMNSVNFSNIMAKPNGAVIFSNSSCISDYCGKIYFMNSSLSLLNNGYEVNDAIDLPGFMVLNKIISLKIENSTFQYNLVNNIDTGSSIKTMFTFNKILNLTVLNSFFQNNFNYDGLFFINQYKLEMPLDIDDKKNLIYENLINIRIENVLFKNNSAFTVSVLTAQFNKNLQNIYLNNCTFLNNFSESDGIISILYNGDLTQEFIGGGLRIITLSSGRRIWAYFSPKNITFKDLNFTKNSFGGSGISLSNLPNLYILNSTWNENGDNLNQNIDTVTINYLKSLGNLYINSSVSSGFPSCQSVISIIKSNNFIFDKNEVIKNYCTSNNAGLALSSCTNKTAVQNCLFSENQSSGYSVALSATMSEELTIKNATFKNNKLYNEIGSSVVALASSTSTSKFILYNCSFIGGELSISASSVGNLIIENCTVDSISNSFYSVLAFYAKDAIKSTILLENCTIKNNNPKIDHISISSSELSSYVFLSMHNMTISNNYGGNNIIFIDQSIVLDPSSQITSSNFTKNNATSIYSRILSGILSIDSCIFDTNTATLAVVLNIDHPTPAETHFSNSKIISNRGSNIFNINGDFDITRLFTSHLYFYNNTSNAIKIAKGNWIDENSYFYQNAAMQGGSVIIKDNSVVKLEGTVFKENLSTSDGGAIYIAGASNITCNNCKIINNTSKNDGGGLSVEQNSIFIFNNSIFSENKSDVRGSAISILSSKISYSYIINTEISYNHAGSYASILSYSGLFSILNCSIFNNAGITNSGIFLMSSTCNIFGSSFSNHTGASGSDLSMSIESKLFIYNTHFHNSQASNSGGSIFVTDSSLTCEKCNFRNISAPAGGTLQCSSGSSCKIISSSILSSYASYTEGIIDISDSILSFINAKIQDYEGSAIKSTSSQAIEIINSEFQNGVSNNGGALSCLDCQNVAIIGTKFNNLDSSANGAILFDQTNEAVAHCIVNIESSIFENCRSLYGGSIYSNNANISINYCTFLNCSATFLGSDTSCKEGKGGAIYLASSSQVNVNIKNSVFTDNKACLSGGAIQWYSSQPIISNSTFSSNSALYGSDLASFPLNLQVLSYQRRLEIEVPSTPGQYLSSPIIVGIMDHYNQIVLTENESSCKLEVTDSVNYSVSGKIKVQALSGIYNFSEIVVSGNPGSTVGFTFSSSALESSLADDSLYFNLRECEVGESSAPKSCLICKSGTYNVVAGDSCKECPESAECYGKNYIYPKPGYWRASNSTDEIFKCPNSDACLGGVETNNPIGDCKEGYYGNLCQSCMDGYSRNGEDVCSKCPNPITNSLIMFGMTTLAIFIVVVLTRSSFKLAFKPKSLTSVYFKIFMNYLQLVAITTSFNLNWPQLVLQFFSFQNSAGSATDQIFSVDCFLQGQEIKPFFSKLIFMALLPLFLAIITIVFWIIHYLCTKNNTYFKNKFIGSLVVQLFLIQPSLVRYNFSTFNCIEIESGSYYLRSDMNIKCWDRDHTLYSILAALPSILIWCIAVPTICLWHIHIKREDLNTTELKLQYGFLYLGFREKTFYWEFIILYRKIFIICCAVFARSTSIQIQALTVFFLILSFFLLHRYVNPYRTNQLNSLETKSILVSGITIYCGLYYLTGDLTYSESIIFFIIIILINIFFISQWFSNIFGLALLFLYSRIRCFRALIRETRIEKWIKNLSPIDISAKETNTYAIPSDIQGESNYRDSVEYENYIDKNNISTQKVVDESSSLQVAPYPSLKEFEIEVDQ